MAWSRYGLACPCIGLVLGLGLVWVSLTGLTIAELFRGFRTGNVGFKPVRAYMLSRHKPEVNLR